MYRFTAVILIYCRYTDILQTTDIQIYLELDPVSCSIRDHPLRTVRGRELVFHYKIRFALIHFFSVFFGSDTCSAASFSSKPTALHCSNSCHVINSREVRLGAAALITRAEQSALINRGKFTSPLFELISTILYPRPVSPAY